MKIIQTHAGPLTNFEVLDFLRSKSATADPMGCLGSAAPSECKVFEYLVQSAVCNQSRDIIKEFMEKTSKFDISKAERLNIINLRPSTAPELYPIIAMVDNRMDEAQLEEMVAILAELLPSPQSTESDKDNTMDEMEAD